MPLNSIYIACIEVQKQEIILHVDIGVQIDNVCFI